MVDILDCRTFGGVTLLNMAFIPGKHTLGASSLDPYISGCHSQFLNNHSAFHLSGNLTGENSPNLLHLARHHLDEFCLQTSLLATLSPPGSAGEWSCVPQYSALAPPMQSELRADEWDNLLDTCNSSDSPTFYSGFSEESVPEKMSNVIPEIIGGDTLQFSHQRWESRSPSNSTPCSSPLIPSRQMNTKERKKDVKHSAEKKTSTIGKRRFSRPEPEERIFVCEFPSCDKR